MLGRQSGFTGRLVKNSTVRFLNTGGEVPEENAYKEQHGRTADEAAQHQRFISPYLG